MRKIYSLLIGISISLGAFSQGTDYAAYVNPFVGTGGHGHTFPGATTPFGMVQLSPDTRIDGSWDGCSGYHYSDSLIYGFSHTHLSGTGCSDYGDIAFLPLFSTGKLNVDQKSIARIGYTHANETASAGYYQVMLNNNVKVELTTTPRVGLQRYTFTKEGKACIILNLKHRDELLEGSIHQQSTTHFSGIRRSKAWATNQVLFYDFELNVEPEYILPFKGTNGDEKLCLFYTVKAGTQVLIKTGISGVDEAGALNNRINELPGWDFDAVRTSAKAAWNKELAKIEVSTEKPTNTTVFYTALYHCMIHPSLYSDFDNRYRGRDNKIHSTDGKFDYYTVFSLWDTYRALHPLLTLIDTKRTNDFINTFLRQYQEGGRLPVWELSSNETDCMIGYHSVSVIWDAYNKGIRGFDANLALEAMKHSAMEEEHGLQAYKAKGYVSSEDHNESVSSTLEFAYDDWCIAQLAKALNKTQDYDYFINRSNNWVNLFNPQSGFFQPKKNGSWIAKFDPYEVNQYFTEANAWQYSLSVQQDLVTVNRLYQLDKHLDELFKAEEHTRGRQQADISGLIGQYAHGNEPSHHIIYAYGICKDRGQAMRSLITKCVNEFYTNAPDGLIGNEDCGQMSAWYVFSAMGFYPLCPGNTNYILGIPNFNQITLHTADGSTSTITNYNRVHGSLHAIRNNGVLMPKFISHNNLQAAHLQFLYNTQNEPMQDSLGNLSYAASETPKSEPVPYFNNPSRNFIDQFTVELHTINEADKQSTIYYSVDQAPFQIYSNSFIITKNCHVEAYSENKITALKSKTVAADFIKLPAGRSIRLLTNYDNQYTAGGDNALIDLQRGTSNWRIGNWQGYPGKDVVVILDVSSVKQLKSIGLGCLQDQGAWIMMPPSITFEGSADGVNYEMIEKVQTNVSDTIDHALTKDIKVPVKKPYRYYRITAKNYGKLPEWHWSKGEPAWLFVDEFLIEE